MMYIRYAAVDYSDIYYDSFPLIKGIYCKVLADVDYDNTQRNNCHMNRMEYNQCLFSFFLRLVLTFRAFRITDRDRSILIHLLRMYQHICFFIEHVRCTSVISL